MDQTPHVPPVSETEQPSAPSMFTRERHIAGLKSLQASFESFSITGKTVFLVAAAVFTFGALSLANKVSQHFMVEVPAHGGTLVEGIVGAPRFVNPLLATSDADRDLSALVYSGLLKVGPDGDYIPDLAESYSISDDGLTYTFKIRPDAVFQDGTPVTADDVEFTIMKAQDSTLKSPRRVSWEGVTVTKTSDREISFTLKQRYAPFIGNLTLGILPRHIWQQFTSEQFPFSAYNLEAIGSGPYKISSIERSNDGVPTAFTLSANKEYLPERPYISHIQIRFYGNDSALIDALKAHQVQSASGLSPSAALEIPDHETVLRAPYTRVFGVFFNQNQKEILAHKEVRKALDAAIDKPSLVEDVLKGFATIADEPLPPTSSASADVQIDTSSLEDAQNMLEKAGWRKDPETGVYGYKASKTAATSTLSFSLSTSNTPELVEAARQIADNWKALGADVDVKIFEPSDLNQTVIRTRKYDALLFGIVTGKNPDLYAFWHSSQRNDPGLNVALYTNATADAALSRMRTSTDPESIEADYQKFAAEVKADTPASFLWSPDFIYVVPDELQGISLGQVTTPSDRFDGVERWYLSTERVWSFLSR